MGQIFLTSASVKLPACRTSDSPPQDLLLSFISLSPFTKTKKVTWQALPPSPAQTDTRVIETRISMPHSLPDSPALPAQHPLVGQEIHIDQLRECGQLFHSRGWSVGTSSNYSVVLGSDPVELIVTASGKDKGRLTREDFVHVGPAGKPIEPDQPKSSAETMLHVNVQHRFGRRFWLVRFDRFSCGAHVNKIFSC